MTTVTVLGAGPAGLLAALEAAEAGHQVTLLEAADHVGGMAGSFDVAGQRVDYGSHRLHPATDPNVMRRIQELLGDDLQARERQGRIRLRGKWVGFPLRAVDMIRSLPADFSASVAMDTARGPFRRTDGQTFAAEITRRLGPTVFREFYEPYAHKLYGADAHDLDRELADRRVAATSPLQILAKVAKASRSDGRLFWYPRQGYGAIAERLADAAVSAGVDVRLSSPAASVTVGEAERTVRWTNPIVPTEGRVDSDLVLSSIPQAVLARIISPAPATAVLDALTMVRTRSMVLVYLVLPQAQYTPFDAHYFPERSVGMCRLSEPKNYRDGDDPKNQTVLCAEYACWTGDEIWASSDGDLAARAVADLERGGLPRPTVVHVESRRLSNVYPVFEPGTIAARGQIGEWVNNLEHVLSFGRQGLDVPDNLHHVLAMARGAVQAMSRNGEIDRSAWDLSLAAFADHVVQD
ncbi:MAG: protoporphyrinogen oxidase [Acidimicrobiales bacterium]|jgi:protoporphyrinogen oxidase